MFVPSKKPNLSPHLEAIALATLSDLKTNQNELFNEEKFLQKMKSLTNQIIKSEEEALPATLSNNQSTNDLFETSERDRFRHVAAMKERRQLFVESLAKSKNAPSASRENNIETKTETQFRQKAGFFERSDTSDYPSAEITLGGTLDSKPDGSMGTIRELTEFQSSTPLAPIHELRSREQVTSKIDEGKAKEANEDDEGRSVQVSSELDAVALEAKMDDERRSNETRPSNMASLMESHDFSGGKGGLWGELGESIEIEGGLI